MFPPHLAETLHHTIPIVAAPVTHPDGTVRGPFTEAAMREWIGHEVNVPGLDIQHSHRIAGVSVSDDGTECRLHVRTELGPTGDLAQHLNLSVHTPEAHIRLVDDETDEVLAEVTHSAPLSKGAHHRVNGQPVRVVGHHWPNRHPEYGCVQAHPETGVYERDVQEVRVVKAPEAEVLPVAPPSGVSAVLSPVPPGAQA